jgi:hypothetical protein
MRDDFADTSTVAYLKFKVFIFSSLIINLLFQLLMLRFFYSASVLSASFLITI